MKILVIPDEEALDHPGLARVQKALRTRFGTNIEEVVLGLPPALATHPSLTGAGIRAIPLEQGLASPDFQLWGLALSWVPIYHGKGGWEKVVIPGTPAQRQNKAIIAIEPHGLIHPVAVTEQGHAAVWLTNELNPHAERHVFVRMGSREYRGASYLFPYNGFYALHTTAFGPIDEFGFRNAVDLKALERRPADHKVVAIFGGSCAFSPACLHDEMFSSVLERKLATYCRDRKIATRFTVVNFGISAFTVLNEMFTYLLFCNRLRPDVVIAHDIFNDLAYGIQTDPHLLNRHEITYMPEFEEWALRLVGSPDPRNLVAGGDGKINLPGDWLPRLLGASKMQLTQSPGEFKVVNGPQAVTRAYLTRKRQFMAVVRASGAQFVWGIQPAWFCKRPSPSEAAQFETVRKADPKILPMYEAIQALYGMVRAEQRVPPDGNLCDIHEWFGRFGDKDTLFVDHAHLTPEGDAQVANAYFEVMERNVLPALGLLEAAQ